MKKFLLNGLKVALAVGLVVWLIRSDKLDLSTLRIFIDQPHVAVMHFCIWLFLYLGLGSWRWTVLMRGLDLDVTFKRAAQLQHLGFFFNTAVPGAVGGDIIKAIYVMREQRTQRKTPALLTVILDRVFGVIALLIIAGVATLFNATFIREHQQMWPLAIMAIGGLVAMAIAGAVVFFPHADGKDPVDRLLNRKWKGFSLLRTIYQAVRSYRHRPSVLVNALAISIFVQLIATAYVWYVSYLLTGHAADVATFSLIYPLALITTAIPVAPGGMGVGHVAFDSFYSLAGWTGGANVFNVTLLGTLALNLTGIVPYLLFKSQAPINDAEELESIRQELATGG